MTKGKLSLTASKALETVLYYYKYMMICDGYGMIDYYWIGWLKWTAWAKGGRVGVHPTLLAPKFFL
jgi:hypothetical protein